MEMVSSLSDWLAAHPHWIFASIAATAFIESLAMLGIVIPGVAFLFAIAAVAGGVDFSLGYCLLAAMLGAVCGDVLSFFLGRHAHGWALRHWPFRNHPEWIERGERFFRRYGMLSVVTGRFIGPIRPVTPFVAGMLSMPPTRFILINLLSALLWAPVYVLPGYLVGSSTQAAIPVPSNFWPLFAGFTMITLAGLLLMFMLHRWLRPGQWLYHLMTGSDDGHRGYWEALRSPRSGEMPAGPTLLLFSCLLGFSCLAMLVSTTSVLRQIDQQFLELAAALHAPLLNTIFVSITLLGDAALLAPVASVLAAALVMQRQFWTAAHWLGGLGLLWLSSWSLKLLLQVPRPALLAQPLDSFAFPSTHAGASTAFFALLAGFVAQQQPFDQRWRTYLIAAIPILAIALSRVYLGVHWISDILGGILLGLAVTGLTRLSYSHFDRQPIRPHGTLIGAVVLSLLGAAGYILWQLEPALLKYAIG